MPQQAGDRVKPARREALPRARRLRAGDLTPVAVPAVDAAAIRALSRAREAVRRERKTAKFRLNAVLLRHDSRYVGRATWGPARMA